MHAKYGIFDSNSVIGKKKEVKPAKKAVLNHKGKAMSTTPRGGKTVLNRMETLFLKKSKRTVLELSRILKVDEELIPRQVRRLKEKRGYTVSLEKKGSKKYYVVS